jgi:hypothetical protein
VPTCSNGHDVRVGAVFCGVCGVDMRVTCVNGHSNGPGARFCKTCGASITDGQSPSIDEEGTALLASPEYLDERPEEPEPSAPAVVPPIVYAADPPPVVASSTTAPTSTTPDPKWRREEFIDETKVPDHQFRESVPDGSDGEQRRSKKPLIIGICALVVVVIGAAVAFGLSSHHSPSAVNNNTKTHHKGHSTPLIWGSASTIDPGNLTSISCSSISFCIAVDKTGNSTIYNGSSWSRAQVFDNNGSVSSVSCPTDGYCVAVDQTGNVFTYEDGSWSDPQFIDSNGPLTSVSCASSSFCMATDGGENVLTYNGNSWSAAQTISSNGSINSISCPSQSFCAAVNEESAFIYDNGTWSSANSIDPNKQMTAVTCTSASFCDTVDDVGAVFTYNGNTWSNGASTGSSQLNSVSCPTSSFCIAVNESGGESTYNGKSWSNATTIDSIGSLTSISCPSSSFCAAVDTAGNVFIGAPSGSTTATTSTTTTTPNNESAQGQATDITTLLNKSSLDRSRIQHDVDVVQHAETSHVGCSTNVSTAVTDFNQVESNREALLGQLATTQMSLIPKSALVRSDLRRAWLMSLRIDKAFAQWASIELANNCNVSNSSVPSYVTTENLDPVSTSIKTTFVNVWNPIASELGQPSHLSWFQV